MSMSLIAMAAAAAASHSVAIDHHGMQVQANYTARLVVSARTVGARTPNRMDMQRCKWTARVEIDRSLAHGPALARTIATDPLASGSESAACPPGDRFRKDIAERHQGQVLAQLAAAVAQDRAPLLAELDMVRNLASN